MSTSVNSEKKMTGEKKLTGKTGNVSPNSNFSTSRPHGLLILEKIGALICMCVLCLCAVSTINLVHVNVGKGVWCPFLSLFTLFLETSSQ